MTKTDNSEKETKGKRFYKINGENDYIRFFYTHYEKEVDGIYNKIKE